METKQIKILIAIDCLIKSDWDLSEVMEKVKAIIKQ